MINAFEHLFTISILANGLGSSKSWFKHARCSKNKSILHNESPKSWFKRLRLFEIRGGNFLFRIKLILAFFFFLRGSVLNYSSWIRAGIPNKALQVYMWPIWSWALCNKPTLGQNLSSFFLFYWISYVGPLLRSVGPEFANPTSRHSCGRCAISSSQKRGLDLAVTPFIPAVTVTWFQLSANPVYYKSKAAPNAFLLFLGYPKKRSDLKKGFLIYGIFLRRFSGNHQITTFNFLNYGL